jgi:hypothetical protein
MYFIRLAVLSLLIILCFSSPVSAIKIGEPPAEPVKRDSPIIITGYMINGWRVGYIQLFNSSDEVVDVAGWKLGYSVSGTAGEIELPALNGLVKPGGYLVVADQTVIPSGDVLYMLAPAPISGTVTSIRLVAPADYLDHSVTVKADTTTSYWKRVISSATGKYLSTFSSFQPDVNFVLYGKGFYEYPTATSLQITEILANPRSCSPAEMAGECRDFVKLYNPTAAPIDLSQFRLRVGYQGQSSSTTNTFLLESVVEPGHYKVITKSVDAHFLSLTSSGAFVWLEDTYGVKRYDATVIEYPDASAENKKGQAWAYDTYDGLWKWTPQPMAADVPSVFPAPSSPTPKVAAVALTPCKEGQYRSEETNRCRSLTTSAALASCDDDEVRNPETNRCRKLASLANAEPAQCKEGQERNPETNRCRNVATTSPPAAAFSVEPIAETGKAFAGWWALGGVGSLAVGYGVWEWRREALNAVQKIATFLMSQK